MSRSIPCRWNGYLRQLSGGQQQRVALARAIVKNPKALLLDEPFSNLDARVRVAAREFVKKIQRDMGITTILVTHDQADAFAVGDRILVIDKGRLQQIGDPSTLYNGKHVCGKLYRRITNGVLRTQSGEQHYRNPEFKTR
ncbi:MAG: ATP-binding cassette domain-containing protein [Acidilobaceae archaeon]